MKVRRFMDITLQASIERLFRLERWTKTTIKLIFDFLASIIALSTAFAVRLENFNFLLTAEFYITSTLVAIVSIAAFKSTGLYNALTQHVSTETVKSIFFGSTISAVSLYFCKYIFIIWLPLSVPLIYFVFLFMISSNTRFLIRAISKNLQHEQTKNIAIYGAGTAGTQLLRTLQGNPDYRVSMFIDDNPDIQGRTHSGVTIYSLSDFSKKLKKIRVDILLFAESNLTISNRQRAFELATENKLQIKIVPNINELMSEGSKINQFRDIDIEDLLGRSPVKPVADLMSKNIEDKTVLVTGAGGSIGRELCKQILNFAPAKLILLDISEYSLYTTLQELEENTNGTVVPIKAIIGSTKDSVFIQRVMAKFDIDTVYHGAAYKHVNLMEQNILQCISNNVFSTEILIKNAIKFNVKNFILISSDKAVNPTNFMGASKRISELLCQSAATKQKQTNFAIVRFGNVLGSSGSVIPLFKRQISAGGPVTVTNDKVSRYFMTLTEAAQLVIQAGSISEGGEIFVLDMGESTKIIDLAKKIITLSGKKPVFDKSEEKQDTSILIKVTNLKHGEKMFEELTYSNEQLDTIHPRIMKVFEPIMPTEVMGDAIEKLRLSITNNDYELLYDVLSSMFPAISNSKASVDLFNENTN
jgi:FlaA1/EpsC-like NDP-sugar epimerase